MKIKTTISEIVKDAEWQKIRENLKGKWKSNPIYCCNQLKKYLGPIHTTTDKKIVIVQNYLTGTAFRIGKIKHSCISWIRTQLSMERKKRVAQGTWNISIIKK